MHHFLEAERQYCISNGEDAPPKGKLCFAYDIGCTNSKTVHRSPLASLANYMGYLPAVGTMHGYAHERLASSTFFSCTRLALVWKLSNTSLSRTL